ncbi:Isoquinoline 1-oxidoreductase subunit [Sphingomonas sp.]|uniref:Isoquinoline 1-oxidoreductase subunit n=1 Tax=Sphingomonas sp. TaxID=28214 RepID=UPI001B28F940|nr:Isoquinoline 1-oxidoreductase subunit [Sphingomonas sp.]MBO9713692.1 Isoquinoline 1-oxidoreductase subunit [Sphingomonas sp.]
MKAGTIALGALALAMPVALAAAADGVAGLRPAADFESIRDAQARSAAIFVEMGKVIAHPRCMNCHPRTDSPTQGNDMDQHYPPVTRGPDGHGAPGMECTTCHGPANVEFANGTGSIPGHPEWHLAPKSMAWQGKSLGEICEQIKDKARNGGKTLTQIVEHNAHDSLVGWAWNPGAGRAPAPGTQAQFGELTKAWVASGAACPAK